jgi:hypothetical protein
MIVRAPGDAEFLQMRARFFQALVACPVNRIPAEQLSRHNAVSARFKRKGRAVVWGRGNVSASVPGSWFQACFLLRTADTEVIIFACRQGNGPQPPAYHHSGSRA